MSTRSSGVAPRRGYTLDRETVLLGAVKAGARGAAAETRTGAARILNTHLNQQHVFKVVSHGQDASAAGGYLVDVSHIPYGGTLGDANWVTVGTIEVSGIGSVELALSGADIAATARAAASVPNGEDTRVTAIRLTAGDGTNGAATPAGTQLVHLDYC